MNIVFFGKERPQTEEALATLRQYPCTVTPFVGASTSAFPAQAIELNPDLIISYMSPWIIPASMLHRAKRWSLNFHPGPPEYPGTGCTNFALYHEQCEYGVTVHHMVAKVDRGEILKVSRFPIFEDDSVLSLTLRSYEHLHRLLVEVLNHIFSSGDLPGCKEEWKRPPFKRSELDSLCEILPKMSEEEIRRRVRATYFPGMPGPFVVLAGKKFRFMGDR